jgi:hypothetical protein
MNSFAKLLRPSAAGAIRPGVPFSSRFDSAFGAGLAPGSLGNRAYIRAWITRQSAKTLLPLRRAK